MKLAQSSTYGLSGLQPSTINFAALDNVLYLLELDIPFAPCMQYAYENLLIALGITINK
jgi:hypothetical protein